MSKDTEDFHQKIRQWLLDEHFSIQQEKDSKSSFKYLVARKGQPSLNLVQPLESNDAVAIICGVEFKPEDLARIKPKEIEDTLWNLRKELLQLGVGFEFLPSYPSFNVVRVNKVVYYDGLTKNLFFSSLQRVVEAALLILWTFGRKIGKKPGQNDKYVA